MATARWSPPYALPDPLPPPLTAVQTVAAGVTGAAMVWAGHPRANFHWRAVPLYGLIAAADLALIAYLTDPSAEFRSKRHEHGHGHGDGHGHGHAAAGHH